MNYLDTDEALAAALARDPGCLVTARRGAVTAWNGARRLFMMQRAADGMWNLFGEWEAKQASLAGKLRIALLAHASLSALGSLSSNQLRALSQHPELGQFDPYVGPVECRAKARTAMDAQPALAAFGAEMDRIAAEYAAGQAQYIATQQAEHDAKRPALWLAAVRAAGIEPRIEGGSLTVTAADAAKLTEQQRAEAAAVRDRVIEALQAEADAAAEASRLVAL